MSLGKLYKAIVVPTVGGERITAPANPEPDPSVGDVFIDISVNPPALKVLDNLLNAVIPAGLSSSPGGSPGMLQFNNAGSFGGVPGSAVSGPGGITLTPTGTATVPLLINATTGQTADLLDLKVNSISAFTFSSTGLLGIRNVSTDIGYAAFNPAGPLLQISNGPTTAQRVVLQAVAAQSVNTFEIWDNTGGNRWFVTKDGVQTIQPGVSNLTGLTINTTGNSTADSLLVQDTGATILRATTNAINVAATAQKGVKIGGGGIEVSLTTQSAPSTFDIVLQTGPVLGSRLIQGSTFGTNDVTHSIITGASGFAVFENNVANSGVIISSTGGTGVPLSFRPNRVEHLKIQDGTGNVMLTANATSGQTGDLLDLNVNNIAQLTVSSAGLFTTYNSIVTVSRGMAAEYAQSNLTTQGANVGTTTLFATGTLPSGTGLYRISGYTVVTRAATTSSTLPKITITWTDADNTGTTQSFDLTPINNGNSLSTFQQGSMIISANTGTNIQFSTSGFASSGGTSMQYALHLRLEAL